MFSTKMDSQFYVTLFSISSQDVYPENTKTRFTCALPQPLSLDGTWEVGLVQFFHDKIIGTKKKLESPITFETNEIVQKDFIDILKTKINPLICTSDYWKDFKNPNYYSLSNSDSIWQSFDAKSSKFKTNDETVMKIKNVFAPKEEEAFKKIKAEEMTIKLERNKTYRSLLFVMKDYLHGYIDSYYKEKASLEKSKSANIKESIDKLTENMEKLLYLKAMEIIKPLEQEATKTIPHGSHFVLIYTDIIKSHVVGRYNSKVLYMSDRGADANDPVVVTNVQYYPIEKEHINDISVLIANDQGEQLVFGQSNPSKPTCLLLPFRKTFK